MKWSWIGALLLSALLPLAAQEAEPGAGIEAKHDRIAGLIDEGKADEALALLKAARADIDAEKMPWLLVQSLLLEGYANAAAERWPAAETAFARVADEYPDWPEAPEAREQVGRARLAGGRAAEARQAWDQVIADAPQSYSRIGAEQALFELDLDEGKLPAAETRVAAMAKAFAWSDDLPWMLLALGQAYLDRDQPEPALARFAQLREQYPGSPAAFSARRPMIEALQSLDRADEALALLAEAKTDRPAMLVQWDIAQLEADLLLDADRPADAAAALGAVAEQYPSTFVELEARLRQARILADQDQADQAATLLAGLLDGTKEPYRQVPLLRGLLDLYQDQENWDRTEDTATRLITLTEGSAVAAEALLRKAEAQWAAGRKKAARASLETAIQTYKGPPVVALAQQKLFEWSQEEQGQ